MDYITKLDFAALTQHAFQVANSLYRVLIQPVAAVVLTAALLAIFMVFSQARFTTTEFSAFLVASFVTVLLANSVRREITLAAAPEAKAAPVATVVDE